MGGWREITGDNRPVEPGFHGAAGNRPDGGRDDIRGNGLDTHPVSLVFIDHHPANHSQGKAAVRVVTPAAAHYADKVANLGLYPGFVLLADGKTPGTLVDEIPLFHGITLVHRGPGLVDSSHIDDNVFFFTGF